MEKLINVIINEIDKLDYVSATAVGKIANKYYKSLPEDDFEMVKVCEEFISSGKLKLFSIATLWLKKRKSIIDMKYFHIYENWINNYVVDWGKCDQLCYRVINPMVEKYHELYEYVIKWSNSNDKNIRRVSLVSFIRSTGKLVVYYDILKVLPIVEKLKDDDDIHVQKAVGWVLKCSYKNYPEEVVNYLKSNVQSLSRLIFRYALENMPRELKNELMALEYK